MPDLRLRLRSDRSAQCPYCHEEVEHRERNRRCAGCDAIQHAECWTEAEACAACGRAERPLPLLVRLSGALAWDRRAQFALRLVLAAAFGHYIWHRTDDLWGAIGAGAVAVAFLEWARLGHLEFIQPEYGASFQRGYELLEAGEPADAIGYLRRAIRERELAANARVCLMHALFDLGRIDAADEEAGLLLEEPEGQFADVARTYRALCAAFRGDREAARELLRGTSEPELQVWLALLGEPPGPPNDSAGDAYGAIAGWARGEASFDELRERVGAMAPETLGYLGFYAALQRDLAEGPAAAEAAYQRALEAAPPSPWDYRLSWARARLRR